MKCIQSPSLELTHFSRIHYMPVRVRTRYFDVAIPLLAIFTFSSKRRRAGAVVEYIFLGHSGTVPCLPRSALKVTVPNRVVTWLDGTSTPISSARLLPKPNGDLHVRNSNLEDTQVLKCLITGRGGNKAKAPEMIVYDHVLFGEFQLPINSFFWGGRLSSIAAATVRDNYNLK